MVRGPGRPWSRDMTRASHLIQRTSQSSHSALETTVLFSDSYLEFWSHLLPLLLPSPPQPHWLLSIPWIHQAQTLHLLFPLPGMLSPQITLWLILWVPLGVCSKSLLSHLPACSLVPSLPLLCLKQPPITIPSWTVSQGPLRGAYCWV